MDFISVHTCKVRGCESRKSGKNKVSVHFFPKKESVGLKWVEVCDNNILNSLDYKDIIAKNLFVCHKHFAEKCYYKISKGFRLINDSYPTLHLPVDNVSKEVVDNNLEKQSNLEVNPVLQEVLSEQIHPVNLEDERLSPPNFLPSDPMVSSLY